MPVFDGLQTRHYAAIYADPAWKFKVYSERACGIPTRRAERHYVTMTTDEIAALPVGTLAADSCALFMWVTWPFLKHGIAVIEAWGFEYKTCAFAWMKAHAGQLEMFQDDISDQMGLGYWTRANSEVCLLATRGSPQRLNMDVRQAIIEPRREHSRKPDCVYERIERLVAGPYLELFARNRRSGWDAWGNETNKYDAADDMARSLEDCYAAVRERKADGGKGWPE